MRKALIRKDKKRREIVAHYEHDRRILKSIINSKNTPQILRFAAQQQLQSLPRDSSKTRVRNRCTQTGRPTGVVSKFKLGRNKILQHFASGSLPGIVRSSW